MPRMFDAITRQVQQRTAARVSANAFRSLHHGYPIKKPRFHGAMCQVTQGGDNRKSNLSEIVQFSTAKVFFTVSNINQNTPKNRTKPDQKNLQLLRRKKHHFSFQPTSRRFKTRFKRSRAAVASNLKPALFAACFAGHSNRYTPSMN